MRSIPVDASKMKFLVVGEPTPKMRNGAPYLDRVTNEPMWNIPVTVIGDFRAESFDLSVPEGRFPKELGIGAFIDPDGIAIILYDRKEGGLGVMWGAKSVKVEGGSAGLKNVAVAA